MSLVARWTRAGRRTRRANREQVQNGLGYLALCSFGLLAAMHLTSSPEPAFESENERRSLQELFKTTPEQCEGTERWLSAPFLALTLYSFIGLAVVTDEYFEPVLALISTDLHLSPDVAGATFMAVGSSAPELLISIVDSFLSKASVGVGTILGSAMFNLLVIAGGTALIGRAKDGGALVLQGYPLTRDSLFYTFSLAVLTWTLLNDGNLCVMKEDRFEIFHGAANQTGEVLCNLGLVTPWEGLLLAGLYFTYVIFMVYNRDIHAKLHETFPGCFTKRDHHRRSSRKGGPIAEGAVVPAYGGDVQEQQGEDGDSDADSFEEEEEGFPGNPFSAEWPSSIGGVVYHILAFPYRLLFFLTMPVCMKDGIFRDLTLFSINIGWITALTFIMVYFGTYAGCLVEIDPFIIGVLLLAIGTSVPDALASFIVARDGHGDMAISNALGSNVFNIFLGLGLPWFISGLAFPGIIKGENGPLDGNLIVTNGLISGMIMLVLGIVIFIGSLVIFKWRMLKPIAALLVGYFLVFVAIILLANRCVIHICIELDCSRCGFDPVL